MKSIINKILCAELYLWVVCPSLMKLFVKIPSVKQRMIKSGYLKIKDNVTDLSNYYYELGKTISIIHFHSKVVLHGCGFLPLWLLICKKTIVCLGLTGIAIISLILSFGIPIMVVEYYVLKNDIWKEYWKQIFALPQSKRRKIIAVACIVVILFIITYCVIFILCFTHVRHLTQ